jgi:ABC-type phosphate transport system substrate-binding protein
MRVRPGAGVVLLAVVLVARGGGKGGGRGAAGATLRVSGSTTVNAVAADAAEALRAQGPWRPVLAPARWTSP